LQAGDKCPLPFRDSISARSAEPEKGHLPFSGATFLFEVLLAERSFNQDSIRDR
jgi:hypothetical protein